jgi:hypothetical protein
VICGFRSVGLQIGDFIVSKWELPIQMLIRMWYELFHQVSFICKGTHPRRQQVSAKFAVTGTVYLDMLEELLMPILEEEGPNDMLFQKSRAPQGSDELHKLNVPRKMDWQGSTYCLAISFTWP